MLISPFKNSFDIAQIVTVHNWKEIVNIHLCHFRMMKPPVFHSLYFLQALFQKAVFVVILENIKSTCQKDIQHNMYENCLLEIWEDKNHDNLCPVALKSPIIYVSSS